MKVLEILNDCQEIVLKENLSDLYAELDDQLTHLQDELEIAMRSGDEAWQREIQDEMDDIEEQMNEIENEDLNEAAIRQFKRVGQEIKKRYRCMSGPKAGKLVATPGACATRKDPKRVRHGRKTMRSKKGTIKRKTRVSKRKQLSKLVTKMNKRLAGKAK